MLLFFATKNSSNVDSMSRLNQQPGTVCSTASLLLLLIFVFSCRSSQDGMPNEGFIAVGNTRVYYTRAGEGEPVLLLHGGFLDHRMWEQQVKALTAGGFQVVTIDLPGHGRSQNGDSTLLVQDCLHTVLDSLSIHKASLVGLALGGTSATDFALAYPGRVKKLLLVSSLAIGYEAYYPIDSLSHSYLPAMAAAIKRKNGQEAAAIFTR